MKANGLSRQRAKLVLWLEQLKAHREGSTALDESDKTTGAMVGEINRVIGEFHRAASTAFNNAMIKLDTTEMTGINRHRNLIIGVTDLYAEVVKIQSTPINTYKNYVSAHICAYNIYYLLFFLISLGLPLFRIQQLQ